MEEVATRVLRTYSLARHGMEGQGNVERTGKRPHLVLAALHSAGSIDPLVIPGKDRNISEACPVSARETGLLRTIGTEKEGGSILGSEPEKCIAALRSHLPLRSVSSTAASMPGSSPVQVRVVHSMRTNRCVFRAVTVHLSQPPCLPEGVIVLQSS